MKAMLPEPSPERVTASQQLKRELVGEIHAAKGWVPFSHYMERVLYSPQAGYYSQLQGLGAQGDFVTAPEISPLFSRVVARQIAPVLASLSKPVLMEFGAGSGVMAVEILLELEQLGQLPEQYLILELSGGLRLLQQQTFQQRAPHLQDRVVWLQQLPKPPFQGVIVANEVLDAIPFDCFVVRSGSAVAYGVSTNPQGELIWSDSHGHDTTQWGGEIELSGLEEGYCSELRPSMRGWIASLADLLEQGMVLLVDYGYSRSEYYRPERSRGTLSCFYRHHRHEDPFFYPGQQDITAHVDFTAVAEAADGVGFTVAGYTTQAYFLLAGGITELAERED
ncbi:MAG TPA: class I SAM-dependent methyltransferase, partial [Gammaproteobacteria bacterium]|nr:class I SAM-dependent methyltransferase [Gammaproteobacteria bacterium]